MCRWLFSLIVVLSIAPASHADESALRATLARHLDDLAAIAKTCGDDRLKASRDRLAEIVISVDPDHAAARALLDYRSNGAGGWERKSSWKPGKNRGSVSKVAGRIRAVSDDFVDAAKALDDKADLFRWRQRFIALAIRIDPVNPRPRVLNDEVDIGSGVYRLGETERSRARRDEIAAAAKRLVSELPEPESDEPNTFERGVGVKWTGVVKTKSWRIVSATGGDPLSTIARRAEAAPAVVALALGTEVPAARGLEMFLFDGAEPARAFLLRHPDFPKEHEAWIERLGSEWLGPTRIAVWPAEPPARLDVAARQPITRVLTREFRVGAETGWVIEGLGLYLTHLLTESRYSYMSAMSRYDHPDDAAKGDVDEFSDRWLEPIKLARDLARGGSPPDLRVRLGRGVADFGREDHIWSLAFATYLVEGRPDVAVRFVRAAADRASDLDDDVEGVFGMDVHGLEARFARWVEEVTK